MQVGAILSEWLARDCPDIHKMRRQSLCSAVTVAATHRTLTVTSLGRLKGGDTPVKHSIKSMDRLVGNPHLHAERLTLYRAQARWLMRSEKHPLVILDWTAVTPGGSHYALRAAQASTGRALTLYEEVHAQREMEHASVRSGFLSRLAAVLPEGCQPILILDAGFRSPWFQAIERQGWHWLARIRNNTCLRRPGETTWSVCKSVFVQATGTPRCLGAVWLTKTNPVACTLHLYRRPPKRRKVLTRGGQPCHAWKSEKSRKREREPWLLATSLPKLTYSAQQAVAAYAKRMQIEEAFRDTKSSHRGWGFEMMRSRSTARIETLLLIAALALLLLTLLGTWAESQHWQKHFQANTERRRRVLSLPYVGWQMLQTKCPWSRRDIHRAFGLLLLAEE